MEFTEILPQVRVDKNTKKVLKAEAKLQSRSLSAHIRHVLIQNSANMGAQVKK